MSGRSWETDLLWWFWVGHAWGANRMFSSPGEVHWQSGNPHQVSKTHLLYLQCLFKSGIGYFQTLESCLKMSAVYSHAERISVPSCRHSRKSTLLLWPHISKMLFLSHHSYRKKTWELWSDRKGKHWFEPFKESETYTARRQKIHQSVTKLCGSKKRRLWYCAKWQRGPSKDKEPESSPDRKKYDILPTNSYFFVIALPAWDFTCWLISQW